MSNIPRRFISRTSTRHSSASAACSEIFERFGSKPISVRKQLLDGNQLQLLSLTLSRPNIHKNTPITNAPPKDGTPIPPGYHLVYFTPTLLEQDLGRDGTDQTVNPLSPFTRRMWAGGELKWNQSPEDFLRVGQVVQETTKMLSAEPKKLKSGTEMLVVGVEKTYENSRGVALVDRRNWVFQKAIEPANALAPSPKPEEKAFPDGKLTRDFCQTEVSLFRFSALTFNGHKIHYSPAWCREVEGHRTAVVHGPLNLINMLDFWRDSVGNTDVGIVPESIVYRAMSPLYVGEPYRILMRKEGGWNAEIWDSYGKQAMKGIIVN
ncbi:hypothetical protein B0J11DRAFT_541768 [Dendryphion nanum]|uniref:Mesaconyl-C(4)-CoA hydratase n=1 Tax=Dendryphion nanum TaxID=256645 RepID=A0A9P9IAV2_9PLEO|nr:hypothetical protein B0J11DRAFT_541768 [Dendryphion nanum]